MEKLQRYYPERRDEIVEMLGIDDVVQTKISPLI